MTDTSAVRQPNVRSDKVPLKSWIAVGGAMLGAFMAVLDIQITNASLKDIQAALGATLEEGSWISTAYLVAEIVVIPLTGWLSRVFSIRLYLLANAGAFIFFSICCALAWNLPSMIVFRALQGFTGGVLIPMALTILLTTLPPAKQPIGMAMFAITAVFAPAIGPTVGGWLTENFSWHYILLPQCDSRNHADKRGLVRCHAATQTIATTQTGRLVWHRLNGDWFRLVASSFRGRNS